MKRLLACIGILWLFVPTAALATFGLTQSLDTESGSSQYARITTGITGFPSGNDTQTVEAWVKFESFPGASLQMTIVGYGADGTNNSAFQLNIINRLGVMKGVIDVYGREVESDGGIGITNTEQWYHYAARYDGTNIIWTVDGVDVQTKAAGTINTTATRAGVGGRVELAAPSNFFDGEISLARVWTVARSEAEIDADKCNVLGATTGLAAEWTLNNVYTDNSGNGNTIVAVNSPVFGTEVPETCEDVAAAGFNFWQFSDF